ncbi:hypothetical protein C3V36_03715 [Lachnospiraceae bacterium oral taxon 500]|nr:hypothetical protein C3V36_03715 [Lachnospiraceae bacterium oral taxon 500]
MKKLLVLMIVFTLVLNQGLPGFLQNNFVYAGETASGGGGLPERYDARELGLVSPVKDQRNSNACWAHAAMSSVETAFKKAGLGTDFYDFSEGHLATNSSPLTDLQSGSTGYDAINYFSRLDGPVKDGKFREDSPFYEFSISRAGKNTTFSGIPLLRDMNKKYHMKFVGDMIVIKNNVEEMKRYIMEYGSVMSSYYQETDRLYGPVMSETVGNKSRVENAYHATQPCRANHAVTLVGWDDNIEIKEGLYSNKTVKGAYLVKNSWGTKLRGMDGYYWISYSSFASDKNYVFTNVADRKENANVYMYDTYGTGSLSGVPVDDPQNIFLNVFARKTQNPEKVTDIPVSLYQVGEQEVDYKVYIGQSNNENREWINDENNFTLVSTDKSINRNGFYTIALLEEYILNQKYFAVKLVINRNGGETPTIGNGKEVNDHRHRSSYIYSSADGKFVRKDSYNLSLRAITEEIVPTVEKVEILPAAKNIQKGEAIQFAAAVTGKNNPSPEVLWKVKNNTDAKTVISSQGVLTVGEDEMAEKLTVVAKSVLDERKTAEVSINVMQDYAITVKIQGQGTAAASKQRAASGEAISLSYEAEAGHYFKAWQAEDLEISNHSFVMPKKDVEITAVFGKETGLIELTPADPIEEPSEETEPEEGQTEEQQQKEQEEKAKQEQLQKEQEEKAKQEQQQQQEQEEKAKPEQLQKEQEEKAKQEQQKKEQEEKAKQEQQQKEQEEKAKPEQPQQEQSAAVLQPYVAPDSAESEDTGQAAEIKADSSLTAQAEVAAGKENPAEIAEEAAKQQLMESYDDIAKDSHYIAAIQFVLSHHLMQGTGQRTFSPAAKTSRAAVVQVLYNFMKTPQVQAENSFADVESGSWYEKSVLWAMQNGIVAGVEKNKFAPQQSITMEQLTMILHNFTKLRLAETAPKAPLPQNSNAFELQHYVDEKSISPWAAHALKWALQNQILPVENGLLDAKAEISREELAVILQKYMMTVGK